jgi:co-chaperonin GroES (HSP10)
MEMPVSKYLPYFVTNRAALTESAQLIGDIILVEKIKFPERRVGGIILQDHSRNQLNTMMGDQPSFYRVLLPGAGYYDDETKADVPLDIDQGDIILTGALSVKLFSTFPGLETTDSDAIGITRHADIQWRFKTEESFVRFIEGFNLGVKAEVSKTIVQK